MNPRRHHAAAVTVVVLGITACSPQAPDYQSILATSSKTNTTPTQTETPVPLWKYLEGIGVTGKQVATNNLTDLTVSIPTPPGWAPVNKPSVMPATQMIAKDGKYPTAMLMVFELTGSFDVAEAAKHANGDAQASTNFKQLDASTADFHGFPSSMIQGSYDVEGKRLHGWNRVVFPTGSPPANKRYVVQLTITSLADEAVAEASDIETIINGFIVAAK